MKNIFAIALVAVIGMYAWQRHDRHAVAEQPMAQEAASPQAAPLAVSQVEHAQFRCDGRQHCSQMASCDEARFFLRNCPDTKMDGDNDGLPCEDWCGHL